MLTANQKEKIQEAIDNYPNSFKCLLCHRNFADRDNDIFRLDQSGIPIIGIICDCGYITLLSAKALGVEL